MENTTQTDEICLVATHAPQTSGAASTAAQTKQRKVWTTPEIRMISLNLAEHGGRPGNDGLGGHTWS